MTEQAAEGPMFDSPGGVEGRSTGRASTAGALRSEGDQGLVVRAEIEFVDGAAGDGLRAQQAVAVLGVLAWLHQARTFTQAPD